VGRVSPVGPGNPGNPGGPGDDVAGMTGGADPFEAFVRRYQDMVFATAVRLLGNPADAEDVAQTVFLRAFQRFDTIGPSPGAAGMIISVGYICAIAMNLLIGVLADRYNKLAVLGVMFHSKIKALLFNPLTVATARIVGGFVILWLEKRNYHPRINAVDELRWPDALKVGFAQALAMIPGTSRSGATIMGGLVFGLSRKTAAEFSFFLAIPTMFAATAYDLYKARDMLHAGDLPVFAVGFVASFVAAMWAVKTFIRFVSNHTFIVFAWYRIVFGLIVLATWKFGLVAWSEV